MVTATPNAKQPYAVGESLTPRDFQSLRRTMMLEHCKWDSQVGDVCTLASFPLVLRRAAWSELTRIAEMLSHELVEAERELLTRPDLHRTLGVPRPLRRWLCRISDESPTPAAGRMLRFDFHWTNAGWRISEVNSDVPGGYAEASWLPRLMAEHFPGMPPLGDPAAAWATVIANAAGDSGPVALLAATGFIEDQQVIAYLARELRQRRIKTVPTTPQQLIWRNGTAFFADEKLGSIVRFYQAEWLTRRRELNLFVGGQTPVANPGWSVLTESKRLPLVWDDLSTPMPTWRQLLPATRDPREVPWRSDDGWLLKTAYCNTGDTVAIRELLPAKQWNAVRRAVWFNPGSWLAQQRFYAMPIESPAGSIYPTLGVYTLVGTVIGVYGRFGRTPLIDYTAIDVAVLLESDDE